MLLHCVARFLCCAFFLFVDGAFFARCNLFLCKSEYTRGFLHGLETFQVSLKEVLKKHFKPA
jgi:hypothetical protein